MAYGEGFYLFIYLFITSIVFVLNLVTMIFGVLFSICPYAFIYVYSSLFFYQEFLHTPVDLFAIILELRRTALTSSEVEFCIMGIYKTPLTWRLVSCNRSHSILILTNLTLVLHIFAYPLLSPSSLL